MRDSTATIERLDLNDQVYARLKDWLATRKLAPGERLSLNDLAGRFGVSRSPVHQALTRLAAENLVEVRPRHGYFVTPLTQEVAVQAYDVRLALELHAAELTVGTLADDELAQLRSLMERTLQAVDRGRFRDQRAYIAANQEFHEYQVDLARNPLLSRIYRHLAVNELMTRLLHGSQEGAGDVHHEHVEIVAGFETADLPRLQRAIRAHVETGKRIALAALDHAGGVL